MSVTFDAETRAHIDGVRDHLNGNHPDTVLLLVRHLDPDAVDAELGAVDPYGAEFAVRSHEGVPSVVRLDFPTAAAEAHDVQTHLLAALARARAACDPSMPLTSLEAELQVTASLRTVHARVRRSHRLTSSLWEVTVEGLGDYPLNGGDEFVYVMISHEPEGIDPEYDMSDYRDQAEGDPVRGAYYTVRRSRPGEVDLWVVEHDHPGTVAEWMRTVQPGAPLALWGPRPGFGIPEGASSLLLVADETGLAAVAALIETASADLDVVAVLETPGADHRPVLPEHPRLRTVWIDRGAEPAGVTNRLLEAVRAEVSTPPDAAFGAAESRQISAVRRHLRSELGMASADVSMTGYWRLHD
jgi:NADPH-dependent ferric siderophore reductase